MSPTAFVFLLLFVVVFAIDNLVWFASEVTPIVNPEWFAVRVARRILLGLQFTTVGVAYLFHFLYHAI